MTMDEFLDYPDGDDGHCYELVDGVLVRMVGSRPRATRITTRLFRALDAFVEAHGLGAVTPPDAVYDFERRGQKDTGLLPDLAVEIASPRQYRPGMKAKAERYLAGGTALVWVVWPLRQQVDVWHPGATQPTILGVGDTLDGESVVPGFRYPVDRLFA